MSKIQVQVKCPGCQFKTKVNTTKPGFMSPVVGHFKCSGCGSTLMSRIELKRGETKTANIFVRVAEKSPMLTELMAEEAAYRSGDTQAAQ